MMPPGVINRRGKINLEGEGVGSWRRQRLLPQGRVPVRAGRVLVASAGSLSSMPAEISALVLSGQQLTNSPGRWLVLSTFYGPTPNHTVLRPVAWSPPSCRTADCKIPLPTAWSCTKECGGATRCTRPRHPAARCAVLSPIVELCSPPPCPAPYCMVLHPTAWSYTLLHGPAPNHGILHSLCGPVPHYKVRHLIA